MAVTDWEIQKMTLTCAATGRPLAEDEEICSALYEEGEGFIRKDYALAAWPPADADRAFSFWRTRVPKKDAPARAFVDDEVILDFFRRLEGHAEPQKQHFRYVLALFLMRKKLLKFKEIRRTDGGMALLLHERTTHAEHVVLDPGLSEEQIEQVSEEIRLILRVRI